MKIFERRQPNPYKNPETPVQEEKKETTSPETEKPNWAEAQTAKTIYDASTEAAQDKGDAEVGKKKWYEFWKNWSKNHESF